MSPRNGSLLDASVSPSLEFGIHIAVYRAGRHRCPRCRLLRQLVGLAAYASDQPAGKSVALCLDCAGLRVRPADYAGHSPQP